MILLAPILDAGIAVAGSTIDFWTVALPIIVSALTGGLITIASKLLDRKKNNAEERKLSAEERKYLAEADKAKNEADSVENEEWRKLYAETKLQYADLKKQSEDQKKQSDEQIERLKKESGEQMDFLKRQISMHSDTLELQSANFETQEETIQELKEELKVERAARIRIEAILKKFQQWAVRNRAELELSKTIEPIPAEVMYL
jgi:flagellar biosynthesis component FlhA